MKRKQAPAKIDEGVDLQGSKKPKPEQKGWFQIVYAMLVLRDFPSFIQQTI